jgi:Ala-tRNA(Pro) deacylase
MTGSPDTYDLLIAILDQHKARYDLIDHAAEGSTETVSALRGHPAAHAAKCIMLTVKLDRKARRIVLAVVPGDRRVDLDMIKRLYSARYVGFCEPRAVLELARTEPGTVLPFTMHPDVELVIDHLVLAAPRLYFNAARLDRSIALDTRDYQRIVTDARVEHIAADPT